MAGESGFSAEGLVSLNRQKTVVTTHTKQDLWIVLGRNTLVGGGGSGFVLDARS